MNVDAVRFGPGKHARGLHALVKHAERRLHEIDAPGIHAGLRLICLVNRKADMAHKSRFLQCGHGRHHVFVPGGGRHMADKRIEITGAQAFQRLLGGGSQPLRKICGTCAFEDAHAELRDDLHRFPWQRLPREELPHNLFRRAVSRGSVDGIHSILRGVVEHDDGITERWPRAALYAIIHPELNGSDAKLHHFPAATFHFVAMANGFLPFAAQYSINRPSPSSMKLRLHFPVPTRRRQYRCPPGAKWTSPCSVAALSSFLKRQRSRQ